MPASRPEKGAPPKPSEAGSVGKGGARKRAEFSPKAGMEQADFAPTRRMPSDAAASLWLSELEGLKG